MASHEYKWIAAHYPGQLPQPPSPYLILSKRGLAGLYRKWRRELHKAYNELARTSREEQKAPSSAEVAIKRGDYRIVSGGNGPRRLPNNHGGKKGRKHK